MKMVSIVGIVLLIKPFEQKKQNIQTLVTSITRSSSTDRSSTMAFKCKVVFKFSTIRKESSLGCFELFLSKKSFNEISTYITKENNIKSCRQTFQNTFYQGLVYISEVFGRHLLVTFVIILVVFAALY